MLFRRGWLVTAGAMLIASPVWPQAVPVGTLSQPDVTFPHGFTSVAGIRELNDRRVIVLDVNDRTVHFINSAWTAMRQIGRHGAGPREYREPVNLFALPGDSAAVLDRGNMRMLVITPDGEPAGFLNRAGAAGESDSRYRSLRVSAAGIMLHPASATDGRGYFYSRAASIVVSFSGKLRLADSVAIERWTAISAKRDTLGFVHYKLQPGCKIGAGMVICPTLEPKAFRTTNQWAIAPGGRLAILHSDPYRVDFVDLAGEVRSGPPIPYDRLRVTRAHKQQWREQYQQKRPMLVVTSEGQSRSVGAIPHRVEPEWPKYLPPFLSGAVHFASDGMLWVQRTTPVDQPPTFDIIDRAGRVVEQVKLPQRRRLVGFGTGTVYLVRIDDVDLEYLERYPLGQISLERP